MAITMGDKIKTLPPSCTRGGTADNNYVHEKENSTDQEPEGFRIAADPLQCTEN